MGFIAGVIDYNKKHELVVLKKMQAALKHRGEAGKIYNNKAAHIINACPNFNGLTLSFSGKLFNAAEIRTSLSRLGHSFLTQTDTEVLLHAYLEWKEDCLEKLNGVFALAIWNGQELFLARDRMGMQPLFFTLKDGALFFASEIKGLLAHPSLPALADINTVAELFYLGPGRTPGCGVFAGIEELKPAHYAVFNKSGLKIKSYWQLTDKPHSHSLEETVYNVKALVLDSITRQIEPLRPMGAFLSGGLDSSVISAVVKKQFDTERKPLITFSIDYKENDKHFKSSKFQNSLDKTFIEKMNDFLVCEHVDIVLDTSDLVSALYNAVEARDLPGMADIDSSLLLAAKEVKKLVPVIFTGECADEIFGGYPWYRDPELRDQFGFPWTRDPSFRKSFLKPEFVKKINAEQYVTRRYEETVNNSSVLPNTLPADKRIKELTNLHLHWFMQTLVDRSDRMAAYNGLEMRAPYCDYRIAEYLYSVPWNLKDYNNTEKGLLRKAMEGILPNEVLWRKKNPYPKTHNPEYLKQVSASLNDIIKNPSSPLLQLVKKKELTNLINAFSATPWYGQLMTTPQTIAYFVQMNYWLTKYNIQLI